MKQLFIIVVFFLFAAESNADDTIYPKDATSFLKEVGCIYSAFAVYKGQDVDSMLGSLKSGQAYSISLCANSYSEGGAKKHDFCWLRIADLKKGVYVGNESYGSAWRDEAGPCTKESIIRLFSKDVILGQMLFSKIKEWKTVDDKTGAIPDIEKFYEQIQEKKRAEVEEKLKKLKYGKFRWWYYTPSRECQEALGEVDERLRYSVRKTKVVKETDDIVTLSADGELTKFYTTKEVCETEVEKLKTKSKKKK